jgi:site-specific recombinase XerD
MIDKDHIKLFHDSLLAAGRSTATASAYASDVTKFFQWLDLAGKPPMEDSFGVDANEFITECRKPGLWAASNGSILRYMSALRAFHRFLIASGIRATIPFVNYRAPKQHRASAHPLPGMMVDVDAMIKASWRPHHRVLIGLCGYAGLRVSEARSITPRSILTDHDGNAWLAVYGKGGTYREVPVADELLTLLVDNAPADPDTPYVQVGDRSARKAITQIAKRAGITRGVSSHDLRHTFGTEVYSKTKDLRVTQELLGHSSSHTTEGYTGITEDSKRAAVMAALS